MSKSVTAEDKRYVQLLRKLRDKDRTTTLRRDRSGKKLIQRFITNTRR